MRTRYVYRTDNPVDPATGLPAGVPVGEDYVAPGSERMPVFTDRYMEGLRSPIDGSDIGSRTRRREHMRLHGVADADDFKDSWAKAAERREAFRRTGEDGKDWSGRLAETMERMQHGRK